MSTTLDLRFDGDTDTVDGIEYTLRMEPDPYMSIMDEQGEGVWCGRIEWSDNDRTTGYPRKPETFCNGRTQRLDTDRGSTLWWEVPADMRSWKAGGFPDEATWKESLSGLRRAIKDILEFGYSTMVLESSDGYQSALGGIEYGAEPADFLRDLLSDIESQREFAWQDSIRRTLDQVGLAGFPLW